MCDGLRLREEVGGAATLAGRMAEFGDARWYAVRRAGSTKPATYRCPLCGRHLPALTEHLLVVPEGDSVAGGAMRTRSA